jgi:hypothetical protein
MEGGKIKKERVPASRNDEAFAGAVIKLMDAAKGEIIYASGEGTTLLLPGVMPAGDEAIQRGVIIKGYLAKPHIRILSDVVARHELYPGKARPKEKKHFLVIDKMHRLVPIRHEEGKKEGWIYWNDIEGANNDIVEFEELISSDEVIGQAERFYKEAVEEFEEGKKTEDDVRIRDSAEKAYCAVVQAANNLILKKGGEEVLRNINSFGARRNALFRYAGRGMRDAYVSRKDYLHVCCFYDGVYRIEDLEEEFDSVGEFLEGIKKRMASQGNYKSYRKKPIEKKERKRFKELQTNYCDK